MGLKYSSLPAHPRLAETWLEYKRFMRWAANGLVLTYGGVREDYYGIMYIHLNYTLHKWSPGLGTKLTTYFLGLLGKYVVHALCKDFMWYEYQAKDRLAVKRRLREGIRAKPGVRVLSFTDLPPEVGLVQPEPTHNLLSTLHSKFDSHDQFLANLLAGLTDREKLVARSHFLEGVMIVDVARDLGVSVQRVCQLAKRVVEKIGGRLRSQWPELVNDTNVRKKRTSRRPHP